jgi:hypothetical protein
MSPSATASTEASESLSASPSDRPTQSAGPTAAASGLTAGEVAGIMFGAIGIVAIACVLFGFYRKRRRQDEYDILNSKLVSDGIDSGSGTFE